MRKRKWKKNLKIAMGILLITFSIAFCLNMFGGVLTVAQAVGSGYQVPSAK